MSAPDDIEEQIRQRRLREEARREKSRAPSQVSAMDDVENSQSTNEKHRISELRDSINERQQRITQMRLQIQDLEGRCNNEVSLCNKEQNELRRLEGVAIDERRNNSTEVTTSESRQAVNTNGTSVSTESNSNRTNNPTQQIMSDEELARHLAAQFAREEEQEEQEEEEETNTGHPIITGPQSTTQFRTYHFGDPSSGGGITFQYSSSSSSSSLPTVQSRTTRHSNPNPNPMGFSPLESFFGNDELLTSGDPFRRSDIGRLPFSMSMNMGRREDPFSSMRILPIAGFPGRMFGGALMNENMDYDTLMRLFPPVPRGAQQSDIQQLPVDTFKRKAKEKEKEKEENANEKKEKEEEEKKENEKKEDEFNRCCICLESFKDGDEIRRLPCLHIFHTAEIDEWLVMNHLCPICRTPIEQNEPQQRP